MSLSDMNLLDLLEDTFLKEDVKDELFVDHNYGDDVIAAEECPTNADDLFASILRMEEDPQLDFDLIGRDLEAIPSSSSDSGLSSAPSLSYEQQLSPLLSIGNDEERMEIVNSADFEAEGSPIRSMVGSVDSPVGSVGSPVTLEEDLAEDVSEDVVEDDAEDDIEHVVEEMDYEPTLVAVVTPNNTMPSYANAAIAVQQQTAALDIDSLPKRRTHVAPQESMVNVRNLACNGKRNIRQLIRVTPMGSGNPRSILLPVSLKDMKDVRTIKIINATQARSLKSLKINQANIMDKPVQMSIKQEDSNSDKGGNSSDEVSETDSAYPRLQLNAEEKRLLQKEGITLPSHYPLTKHEERELKRIRRKIRNKISAQDSRKRKKEYVDGLEDRVKQCTEENMTLLKRIKALQCQNQSLASQLKRLQALIQKGNKSAQPATCLMVLLLSLALVAVPNLRPHNSNNANNDLTQEQEQPEKMPLAGRSRTLLYTSQLMDEELQQYGEELLQEVEGLLDHDYSPVIQMPLHKRPRIDNEAAPKHISSASHVRGTLGSKLDVTDRGKKKKLIEPPLDDVWPPPNPGGRTTAKIVDKLDAFANELKLNISDAEGTRTVLVKVPREK